MSVDMYKEENIPVKEFIDRMEKLYFILKIASNEVNEVLRLNQLGYVSSILRGLGKNYTIMFESLISYISNLSMKLLFFENRDWNFKADYDPSKYEKLKNMLKKRKKNININEEEEDNVLLSENEKVKTRYLRGVFQQFLYRDLGDDEEIKQREEANRKRIEREAKELIKLINKEETHNIFSNVTDPGVIMEVNRQVYRKMILDSKMNAIKLREKVAYLERFSYIRAEAPMEIGRLVQDILQKVEETDIFAIRKAIPRDSRKNYNKAEKDLLKMMNDKCRFIAERVIEFIYDQIPKKAEKKIGTKLRSKDVDDLMIMSMHQGDKYAAKVIRAKIRRLEAKVFSSTEKMEKLIFENGELRLLLDAARTEKDIAEEEKRKLKGEVEMKDSKIKELLKEISEHEMERKRREKEMEKEKKVKFELMRESMYTFNQLKSLLIRTLIKIGKKNIPDHVEKDIKDTVVEVANDVNEKIRDVGEVDEYVNFQFRKPGEFESSEDEKEAKEESAEKEKRETPKKLDKPKWGRSATINTVTGKLFAFKKGGTNKKNDDKSKESSLIKINGKKTEPKEAKKNTIKKKESKLNIIEESPPQNKDTEDKATQKFFDFSFLTETQTKVISPKTTPRIIPQISKSVQTEDSTQMKKLTDKAGSVNLTSRHFSGFYHLLQIIQFLMNKKPKNPNDYDKPEEYNLRITRKDITISDHKPIIKYEEKIVDHIKEVKTIIYVDRKTKTKKRKGEEEGGEVEVADFGGQTDPVKPRYVYLPVKENFTSKELKGFSEAELMKRGFKMYPMSKDELDFLKNLREFGTLKGMILASECGKRYPNFEQLTQGFSKEKLLNGKLFKSRRYFHQDDNENTLDIVKRKKLGSKRQASISDIPTLPKYEESQISKFLGVKTSKKKKRGRTSSKGYINFNNSNKEEKEGLGSIGTVDTKYKTMDGGFLGQYKRYDNMINSKDFNDRIKKNRNNLRSDFLINKKSTRGQESKLKMVKSARISKSNFGIEELRRAKKSHNLHKIVDILDPKIVNDRDILLSLYQISRSSSQVDNPHRINNPENLEYLEGKNNVFKIEGFNEFKNAILMFHDLHRQECGEDCGHLKLFYGKIGLG